MRDLKFTFCTSKYHVIDLSKGRVSHVVCQGFPIEPHGKVKVVERRTVGIAFDVVRELSCQSVETFAPQEMVLESNRPPGVIEPRSDKTGRRFSCIESAARSLKIEYSQPSSHLSLITQHHKREPIIVSINLGGVSSEWDSACSLSCFW